MQSSLTLSQACQLLMQHGLLREIIQRKAAVNSNETPTASSQLLFKQTWSLDAHDFAGSDTPFSFATYDTRQIQPGTLLFVKGNFQPSYLAHADEQGLTAYVSERNYADYTRAIGLIVNDERQAMALLAARFFGNPERELTIVGITGTKGKTTTAYYTHAILSQYTHGKTALFSSVDNCVDGKHYVESDLTTPESFDAFRMMREARNAGMTHLVMEVSSQSYKVHRVDGIQFAVGAFLNISPDHISDIEHPTFEDYLYCKRQIIANSKRLVLGADIPCTDLLLQDADNHDIPVISFARIHEESCNADEYVSTKDNDEEPATDIVPDVITLANPNDAQSYDIALLNVDEHTRQEDNAYNDELHYDLIDTFGLSMAGDFNAENAAAAVAIIHALGIDLHDHCQDLHAIEPLRISGRMEIFEDTQSHTVAVVDYAHNYLSLSALLNFVDSKYASEHPYISVVTGSTGNKAYDRREEIVRAGEYRINEFIFTVEDTDTEDPQAICKIMQEAINNPSLQSQIIIDRTQAIETAVQSARQREHQTGQHTVILAIGKGDERWIKQLRRHVPYEGDSYVIKRLFGVTQQAQPASQTH